METTPNTPEPGAAGITLNSIRQRLTPEQQQQLDRLAPHAKEDLVDLVEDVGLEEVIRHWELYYYQGTQY